MGSTQCHRSKSAQTGHFPLKVAFGVEQAFEASGAEALLLDLGRDLPPILLLILEMKPEGRSDDWTTEDGSLELLSHVIDAVCCQRQRTQQQERQRAKEWRQSVLAMNGFRLLEEVSSNLPGVQPHHTFVVQLFAELRRAAHCVGSTRNRPDGVN